MSSKARSALTDQSSIRVRGKLRAWLMGRRDARRGLMVPTNGGAVDSSYLRSIRAGRSGKVVARAQGQAERDLAEVEAHIEEGMGPYLLNLEEAQDGSKEARYLCDAVRTDVAQTLQQAEESVAALARACQIERLRYDALSSWYLRGARATDSQADGRDEIAAPAQQAERDLAHARTRYENLLLQHLPSS